MSTNRRRSAVPVVDIIHDGGIATGTIGRGRIVPVIYFDKSRFADLTELVRVHEHVPPGDVESQWGSPKKAGRASAVHLRLDFRRPMALEIELRFKLPEQGILVDQALRARGLYLQPGQPGDTLSNTLDKSRILVSLPDHGFDELWEKIYRSAIQRNLRDEGVSRGDSRRLAEEFLTQIRSIGDFHLPG